MSAAVSLPLERREVSSRCWSRLSEGFFPVVVGDDDDDDDGARDRRGEPRSNLTGLTAEKSPQRSVSMSSVRGPPSSATLKRLGREGKRTGR